jgi:MFS superfamily sulfate permease-like transporter
MLRRILSRSRWTQARRLSFLRRELTAGLTAGLGAVPVCIASGVLAYAPLGLNSLAQGAAAGLTGGAFSAIFAAIFASPSFVISAPRASISIIQATLAAFLLRNSRFVDHPAMIIDAMSLCGLLAGVWQMLFSVFGIERIIKCTPHPVLAGFINGVALLVILQQALQLLDGPMGWQPGDDLWIDPHNAVRGLLALAVVGVILLIGARSKRLPAMLIGLLVGVGAFSLGRLVLPHASLGPLIETPRVAGASYPLFSLLGASGREALFAVAPSLLLTSLILALVAALESLLAYRVAQNLSHVRTEEGRDVFGQGVGNFVSALFGGVASAASSAQLTANYEAGGRSRLSVLMAASLLLVVSVLMSRFWSVIPAPAVWAVLLAVALLLFDQWSLRSLRELLLKPTRSIAAGSWKNIVVAATVTFVTASGAVIGGVLIGAGLACVLFIADMSRAIVRRRYRGDAVFSKRVRPTSDINFLRESGSRRAVLELQGVMFFGNADELSNEISELFAEADMLVLDMRGVTDIDFSAATILQYESTRARRSGKRLLLSGVLPQLVGLLTEADGGARVPRSAIFPDLDAALEWMEEEVLRQEIRSAQEDLPLDQHELVQGLTPSELAIFASLLRRERFRAGAVICSQGDEAQEMWILTRGSVSVRLLFGDGTRSRRITSLGRGTVVGEIAFLEGGERTATIIADEDVECYVLERPAYAAVIRDHPQIGVKLLSNLLREEIHRLRNTSDELRAMSA